MLRDQRYTITERAWQQPAPASPIHAETEVMDGYDA
jgi:hypothetical protein